MTLTEKIAQIDAAIEKKITRQCDPPQVRFKAHGRVRPLYSQQDKRVLLMDSDLKKVTVESSVYDFQSAHTLEAGRPKPKADYGQFERFSHELRLVYLGVSKSELDFVKVLQCFEHIEMLSVETYDMRSEQVIRDDWKTPVNDERNYNPNLYGFRIEYTLQINELTELV